MSKNDNINKTNSNKGNSGALSFVLILLFSVITLMLFIMIFLFINGAVNTFSDNGKGTSFSGNNLKNFFYIKNNNLHGGELNKKNVLIKNEFNYVRRIVQGGGGQYYYPLEGREIAAYYVSGDGSALCVIDKEGRVFINEYKNAPDFLSPRMVWLFTDEVDVKNKDNIKITDDGLYVYIRNLNGVLYCYDRKNMVLNTVDYETARMELQRGGGGVVYVSNRGVVKFYDLKRDIPVPSVIWYEKENAVAFHKDRVYYFYNDTLNVYNVKSGESVVCGGVLSNAGKLRFSHTEYFGNEMYVYLTRLGKKNVNEVYRADSNGNLEYVDSRIDGYIHYKGEYGYIYLKDRKLEHKRDGIQNEVLGENVDMFEVSGNGETVVYKTRDKKLNLFQSGEYVFISDDVTGFSLTDGGNNLVYLKLKNLYYTDLNGAEPWLAASGVDKFFAGSGKRVAFLKLNNVSRGLRDIYFFDITDMETVIIEQGVKRMFLSGTF